MICFMLLQYSSRDFKLDHAMKLTTVMGTLKCKSETTSLHWFFELPFFEPKNQCLFKKWFHDSLVKNFLKVSCVTSGLLMKKSFGKMLKMVSSKKPRTMVAQRRRWNVGGRFLELHLHHVSLLHWVNFGIRFGIKPSPFMDSHTLAFVSLRFLYLFSTFKIIFDTDFG